MKKIKKFVIRNCTFVIVLMLLIMPVFSFAVGLVPCDGTVASPCDFNAFMKLVHTVIWFILVYLAVPIAAIMFVYAGFLMVTSGGSAESKTKAKAIFTNAVIGLVFAAAAWLIIRTLLAILGYQGAWIFDGF